MALVRGPRCTLLFALGFVVWIACAGCGDLHTPPAFEPMLQKALTGQQGPVHYFAVTTDLDGDELPEWIVHLVGPTVCGTGGCDTLVFTELDGQAKLVTQISLTRPPIVVAEDATNGWRDLIVHVAGGGILPGHDARLRYDGSTYPTNPTVKPAEPRSDRRTGVVMIPAFQSFTEGKKLQ